jgi:cell wall-associated NlpC family hydrolase
LTGQFSIAASELEHYLRVVGGPEPATSARRLMPTSTPFRLSWRGAATVAATAGLLAGSAERAGAQGPLDREAREVQAALTGYVRAVAREDAARLAAAERTRILRDSIVSMARAQIGKRYRYGGATPTRGFDCSGLIQYVAGHLGLAVPRTAARQAKSGAAVPADTSQLRPGDLLTFGTGRRITHVGIYVGEGRFIHASSKAGRVIESAVNRPLVKNVKPWRGARRLLVASSDTARMAAVPGSSAQAVARTLAD